MIDHLHNVGYLSEFYKSVMSSRKKFLIKHSESWPFLHNVVDVDGRTQMDPLIVPLVSHLNKITGIKTVSSCQGVPYKSPYVFFVCDSIEGPLKVLDLIHDWHSEILEGWLWNNAEITLASPHVGDVPFMRNGSFQKKHPSWYLRFYDTLTLIKFTKEFLFIPVEKQIEVPGNMPFNTDDRVSVEEIEKALKVKK